jgi:hypothetical protein
MLIKYIIISIYNFSSKRAKRSDIVKEQGTRFNFGFFTSILLFFISFSIYRITNNYLPFRISVKDGLIFGSIFIIVNGIILGMTLNFKQIEKIKLTKNQITQSRIFIMLIISTLIISAYILN